MITTMPPAPAAALVLNHADLFRQLGANKVEPTGVSTVTATYADNSRAVNAAAMFNDTVQGVKLVVANQSITADVPTVSANGIADLLRGVAGLEVSTYTPRGMGTDQRSVVEASTTNHDVARVLGELVRTKPTENIDVQIRVRSHASAEA